MNQDSLKKSMFPAGGIAGVVALLAALLLPIEARAAGGAYAVDDAEVDKPGSCKVESWASFAANSARDFAGVVAPACVVSLGRPVELGAQFQRSRSDGEWGTALALHAKVNILPVETGKIGLGLSVAAPFDLITRQSTGFSVNVPLTYQFSEQFKVNVNAGWLYERADQLNWLTWGAGFEWQFVNKWTLIGEAFGQLGRLPPVPLGDPPPPESIRQPRLQAGVRFTPVEMLDLDLIFGRNITGENANWLTFGVNFRF
jgi:hypothetical protein